LGCASAGVLRRWFRSGVGLARPRCGAASAPCQAFLPRGFPGTLDRRPGDDWIEPDFWDWRVEPSQHAVDRFAERAQPPSFEYDYLRRGAARPGGRRGLALGAPAGLVVALPRRAAVRGRGPLPLPAPATAQNEGRWQPTTLVTEYEELTWADALAEGRVRLPAAAPPAGRAAPGRTRARATGDRQPGPGALRCAGAAAPRRAAFDHVAMAGLAGLVDRARRPAPADRSAAGRLGGRPARAARGRPGLRAASGGALAARARARLPAQLAAGLRPDPHNGAAAAGRRRAGLVAEPPVSGGGRSRADGPARADRPSRSGPAGYSQPPGPPR
jgi:hypothetical protein